MRPRRSRALLRRGALLLVVLLGGWALLAVLASVLAIGSAPAPDRPSPAATFPYAQCVYGHLSDLCLGA